MNNKPIVIEEIKYNKIDEGLLQPENPFEVNIDEWTYDKRHRGYQAITNAFGDLPRATILYVSTTGSGALKLIDLYNNMRNEGEKVGYIEGLPENDAMGELYV